MLYVFGSGIASSGIKSLTKWSRHAYIQMRHRHTQLPHHPPPPYQCFPNIWYSGRTLHSFTYYVQLFMIIIVTVTTRCFIFMISVVQLDRGRSLFREHYLHLKNDTNNHEKIVIQIVLLVKNTITYDFLGCIVYIENGLLIEELSKPQYHMRSWNHSKNFNLVRLGLIFWCLCSCTLDILKKYWFTFP